MSNIFRVDPEAVKKVEWKGNAADYDTALSRLGPKNKPFFVCNPYVENSNFLRVKDIPPTDQCVVYKTAETWVIKYFPRAWTISKGYKEVEIDISAVKPEHDDAFSNWSEGFQSGLAIYQKILQNPTDKESKDTLYRLCSKSVGEYVMHGALDAILYIKKMKNVDIHKITKPTMLKRIYKDIYNT